LKIFILRKKNLLNWNIIQLLENIARKKLKSYKNSRLFKLFFTDPPPAGDSAESGR